MFCFSVGAQASVFVVSTNDFRLFMDLAIDHQWTPAGTVPDPEVPRYENMPQWDGEYLHQEGEIVTQPDAEAWAAGLERALQVHAVGLGETHTSVYHKAQEFIVFLRQGAFQIY